MSSNFFKNPPLQPGFTTFKMPNWYPPGHSIVPVTAKKWAINRDFFSRKFQPFKSHPAPRHPSLHQDLLGFLVYIHIYLKLSSSPPMQFSWCLVSTHHLLLNHLMNVYMNQQGLNPGLMRSCWTSPQSSHGSSGQVSHYGERSVGSYGKIACVLNVQITVLQKKDTFLILANASKTHPKLTESSEIPSLS